MSSYKKPTNIAKSNITECDFGSDPNEDITKGENIKGVFREFSNVKVYSTQTEVNTPAEDGEICAIIMSGLHKYPGKEIPIIRGGDIGSMNVVYPYDFFCFTSPSDFFCFTSPFIP